MKSELKSIHRHIVGDYSSELIWASMHAQPLSFAVIPDLRKKLCATLKKFDISIRIRQNLCQSLTEVLSNLIEHPIKKASFVDIKIRKNGNCIHFCIRDNSTPFLNFHEKIRKSRQIIKQDQMGIEVCGRGLGLITCLHKNILYLPSKETEDGYNHFCIIEKNGYPVSSIHSFSLSETEKENRPCIQFSPYRSSGQKNV